jgi:phosphoglycerol transferase MdoB-like AlkP superfamily enzyme
MVMTNRIYQNILVIAKIYFLTLALFTFYRLILFFSDPARLNNAIAVSDIFYAFFMGLRFDIVISGYILILPYLILTIQFLLGSNKKALNTILFYYVFVLFSLAFIVCAADIPYFNQFFSRFSVTAFGWLNSPVFVFKMIIEEPRYWLYFVPFVASIVILYKLLRKIFNFTIQTQISSKLYLKIAFSILFLGLIFLGIRGRTDEKSPIRVGTAYFCNNPFLNQLGLNPNFTLIRSYLDSRKEENKTISLMNDSIAIANVQEYLKIGQPDMNSPLRRKENSESIGSEKHNVIIIIMESMSAAKMKRHGNTHNLTPFLDSISNEGYYFENAYTAGIHTFNGIFSTLFSFPAIFRQHPMNESSMLKYSGIGTTLKGLNYSTIYFTTHDGQFDNVEGFLKENDFETVVSKKDYPSDKVKTTLGVPDDYMFEFSIPILNKLSARNKPFMAAFMTASDHGPFYLPEYFNPKNMEMNNQIVEYADYSLNKFIKLSSKQKWFNNTLFVFVADHGAPINAIYDLSLDYNHTPLIFYAPHIFKERKTLSNMAGQIDIFPSIMGLLNLPFDNKTLGINLFKDNRPYIFFNADDKYGVIDKNWLLIVRTDKFTGLYKYQNMDLRNYANEEPEIVSKMKTYAESNLQAYQYIITNKKQ